LHLIFFVTLCIPEQVSAENGTILEQIKALDEYHKIIEVNMSCLKIMYKHWEILETLPIGWSVDKTAGVPLSGCEFVTNGKSVLNGQKRALLRIKKKYPVVKQKTDHIKPISLKKENKHEYVIDGKYVRTVNKLARKQFEEKLLKDIRFDLMVCEIEGWDKLEYIKELKTLIDGLGTRSNVET